MISRGLKKADQLASVTPASALRAARTHFLGDLEGWLDVDRDVARRVCHRLREARPQVAFAAFTGVDKVSHARGHQDPMILDALSIVNDAVATIRADAERDGRWETLALWIVSDHGHAPVSHHEDLVRVVQDAGFRTMSHPWLYSRSPEIAVMVSGNAMAHLYTQLSSRTRPNRLDRRARDLVDALLARPSVDLAIAADGGSTMVASARRGIARVWRDAEGYHYHRETGDPLRLGGDIVNASADVAHEATMHSDYPDAIVQIVHLATAPRAGEIILSAARDWDLRARYEPIPHASAHGALLRDHMIVPLLVNRPIRRTPRRTVDVMPSALAALQKTIPRGLDGRSYL
jgi:hypothetical protein